MAAYAWPLDIHLVPLFGVSPDNLVEQDEESNGDGLVLDATVVH